MSRHNQKPKKKDMVCVNCKSGLCYRCVDVLRALYTDERICTCTRRGHDGEPRDKQILDPETGTVYAPGLAVTKDGKVQR